MTSAIRARSRRTPNSSTGWRPRPARIGAAGRRRTTEHLPERASQLPKSDVPGVRFPGAVLDDGPAERLERAGAGVDAVEQPVRDPAGEAVRRADGVGEGRGE